jgi:hypothetical protein
MAEFEVVEGPSFPLSFKVLATAMVAAVTFAGAAALQRHSGANLPQDLLAIVICLALVVLYGWGAILGSRTSFDGQHIRQRWLWAREVRVAELTQVKLIQLPGLAWLVAPRLVVRTGGIATQTFHAAAPQVLAAFHTLAYGRD